MTTRVTQFGVGNMTKIHHYSEVKGVSKRDIEARMRRSHFVEILADIADLRRLGFEQPMMVIDHSFVRIPDFHNGRHVFLRVDDSIPEGCVDFSVLE